jgi:hypothetical protein
MPSQPPPSDTPTATANVLALETLAGRRRPGRPKSIRRAPDADEIEQYRRVAGFLRSYVEADPVVAATSAVEADRTSTAKVDAAMLAIAREAAGLGWERQQAQTQGRRDAEKISSRRVDALSRLASLVGERARLGPVDDLDAKDPKVQLVVADFVDRVREVATETLVPDVAEKFLVAFVGKLEGWETHVR